jgi:hypothetical protein
MKRFRNIAVRMRPPAPPGASDADADTLEDAPALAPDLAADPAPDPPPDPALETSAPPMPNGTAGSDAAAPDGPLAESPAPGARRSDAAAAAPAAHIWDLDPPEPPQPGTDRMPAPQTGAASMPAATPDPAHRPSPALERRREDAAMRSPDRAGPMPGRAKTRVLGFTDAARSLDPLAGAPRAAAGLPGARPEPRVTAGWLVIVEGPGRGMDFPVTAQVASLGRDPDQAICLDFGDLAISRQGHASVVYDPEQARFFLGQGGKSNVVRRNGQPVLATEELHDGDRIRIGKTTLLFKALCGPDFTWEETAEGTVDGMVDPAAAVAAGGDIDG